jgi:hypothetical protein
MEIFNLYSSSVPLSKQLRKMRVAEPHHSLWVKTPPIKPENECPIDLSGLGREMLVLWLSHHGNLPWSSVMGWHNQVPGGSPHRMIS